MDSISDTWKYTQISIQNNIRVSGNERLLDATKNRNKESLYRGHRSKDGAFSSMLETEIEKLKGKNGKGENT